MGVVACGIGHAGASGAQYGFVAQTIVGSHAVHLDVFGQVKRQAGTGSSDVYVAIAVDEAYGLTCGNVEAVAGGVGGIPTQAHFFVH